MAMVEILIVVISLLLLWFMRDAIKFRNRPPGPMRLPVVGTLLSIVRQARNKPPFVFLNELTQTYGKVFSLQTGVLYQVTVSDFELMKEILTSEIWVNRYQDAYMLERSFGKPLGIIFISGDVWKEMRRFTTRTLRDFGFGKKVSMEGAIEEELNQLKSTLNSTLSKSSDKVVGLNQFFTISVLNILWSMIAGHRFSYDDTKLQELIQLIDEMSKANPIAANPILAFPFLRHVLPKITAKGKQRKIFVAKMQQFFRQLLEQRRQLGAYKEEQRDFIDVFLKEIDTASTDPTHKNSAYYTDEQFILVTFDLFVAGSDTTSNSLEFLFHQMVRNPKVQKNVQKEIDQVLGSRTPTAADRTMMPYTEATILETQRLSNVLPMIVRCPTQDTKIGEFQVPKETLCVLNTYAWHLDPNHWEDPLAFKPERFLNQESTAVVNAHKILPFGLGKRVCLGEVLAKATMFTYFTALLQSYNFEASPNHPLPSAEPQVGFTLSPHPYFVKITPR